ncbi:MAG: NAD(P)-dependent oxidoreductase [Pelagibacterales bacterium]|nr:NAD(P)-dependent oxidoreductase [Pelagibacterales bacterium]
MLSKIKILIIGGNGFLGQGILKVITNEKYEVSILDPYLDHKKLKKYKIKHLFNCSTLNDKDINSALNIEEWDYIVHLAAFGGNGNGLLKAANENFNKAVNINVTGFANLLDKLKNKKAKIIWSSSTVVFGEEKSYKNKTVKEHSILKPLTNYGLTKLMAEEVANYYIKNYKMNITGIRLPIIIGPGLNYRGVAAGISEMALATKTKSKCIIETPPSSLDIIYIKDAANLFIKMINSKTKLKNIYNCASIRTTAIKLADSFNKISKKKNIKINNIGMGATYPIMDYNMLKKDINFSIKYTINKLIKDWLIEI